MHNPPVNSEDAKIEKTVEETLPKSKGEKMFDWLVYGGIAGLGVLVATVPIAYWSKYGGGSKGFAWAEKQLQKTGMSARSAHDAVITTALMQGGNLALIPIKIAENHKAAAVSYLNKKMGEPDTYCAVEGEPDQTWTSLIKSRLVAWGAVFSAIKGTAMAVGPEQFDRFENGFSRHLVCKPLGLATHINGQETRAFRLGKLTALDVFATAAAATILYGASRVFAEPDKSGIKHADNATEMLPAAALVIPDPDPARVIQPENAPEKTEALAMPQKNILAIATQKRDMSFAEAARSSQKKDAGMALAE